MPIAPSPTLPKSPLTALAAAVALLVAAPARAQCTRDTECKGERICAAGSCTEPHITPLRASPHAAAEPGWTGSAAVLGLLGAGTVLALCIASDATRADALPSIPLGASATLLLAGLGPLTAHGASSGPYEDARGKGWLVAGWTAWGLALLDASALLALGFADVRPPPGVITLTGLLGAVSLGSFAAHALTSPAEPVPGAFRPALTLRLRAGELEVAGLVLEGHF